ncbi:MAG: hypothetical protein OEM82_02160 [Acidobacteriota bacterium]|nr:hypothetical protein [Acidobacteriota bacterium]MDH3529783.1 hypothetical protein [Acidobacteriota bacterium]
MSPDPDDFDCVKCGACCIYFAAMPQFIPIARDDVNAEKMLGKGYAYRTGSGGALYAPKEDESAPALHRVIRKEAKN